MSSQPPDRVMRRGWPTVRAGGATFWWIVCGIAAVLAGVAAQRCRAADAVAVGALRYAPASERLRIEDAPPDIRPFYVQPHAPPFPRDLAAAGSPDIPPWLLATADGRPRPDRVVHAVLPRDADPAIGAFADKSLVLFDRNAGNATVAPLLVWLSGTGGTPLDAGLFLPAAADAGYRVVALEYDALPAGTTLCDRDPDPACFTRYRDTRVWGDAAMPALAQPPSEAIVRRLDRLLGYLSERYPDEGWGAYRSADGAPAWPRIAVGGQSMGAGMAAFIAKGRPVARVILSSSPWDHEADPARPELGPLAAWLGMPSATPIDRWVGIYHRRETMASTLARAYRALGLDDGHILVSTLIPDGLVAAPERSMVFHGCWFGAPTPLDRNWRPTAQTKATWSFLLGRPVP